MFFKSVLFSAYLAVFGSITFCSSQPAFAATIETVQLVDAGRNLGASDITAAVLSVDGTVWTGWMLVAGLDDVAFVVDLTDANSSIVSVSMRCETSTLSSTADDAGANVCFSVVSGATETYSCPGSKILASNPGTQKWQWTVEDVNAKWLNCLFTAAATITATVDVLTVTTVGITP